MIVDTPLDGQIIIKGDKASRQLQDYFEDVTRHINGTASEVYTVATVPAAADHTGHMIYVSDETGGATIAFSDGTDWRRCQDRAVIS